ncbi:MAG TPA: GNAT family N-acetyltransferase [Bradyrhizobium sp.]|nr:GNAT family N-acetyltransferase [Bradyrhizobium sp.]
MSAGFVIAPLAAAHDRQTFSCGAEPLDRYLRTQATEDVRRHIANCFVASPLQSNAVAGYYALSAASIPMTDLSPEQARKLPRYPVLPAALIGRLAVDRSFQGRQLGGALLFDAIARAIRAGAAVFALLVDAKDEAAARFYRHHGFQAFSDRAARLFLPVATAARVVEG